MGKALVQLRRYEQETPELLVSPQVFNITNLIEYFYGVTWNLQRTFVFNCKQEQPGCYEDRVKRFSAHDRFLRTLKAWILFFVKDEDMRQPYQRQHPTLAPVSAPGTYAQPGKHTGLPYQQH